MENLSEKIVACIEQQKKRSCTTDSIRQALNLTGSQDFILLQKTLEELEDKYQIFRNDNGTWSTQKQRGYYEAKISINKKGMGFIDREPFDSLRIPVQDTHGALHGDIVIYSGEPYEPYGKVIAVKERAHEHIIALYAPKFHGAKTFKLVPEDEKLKDKRLIVEKLGNFSMAEGTKVLCKIISSEGQDIHVTIERVIGHKDDPGVDILSVLLENDIVPEFPDEVLDCLDAVPTEVTEEEIKDRKDLRKDITVTIDGDDSKDFDDAVSVKTTDNGWNLKVSIADVSNYVTEGSPLDKEAYARGCSTYVVDRVVPMLPHKLSNGICSLNPKVDRFTLTCEMSVNKDGSIADYTVYPSVICSTERMTYGNVNKILDGNADLQKTYSHLGSLCFDLRDCADAIRSYRYGKGAIDFDTEEAEIKVDKKGNPVSISLRQRGHAERMIEDCMIAANVCVANLLHAKELPCVYRIHEEPQAKKLKSFVIASKLLQHPFSMKSFTVTPKEIQQYLESIKDVPEYPVLSMMLLRCMQKARYDANCIGHFGLAEKEYLHFTSPIRRYPDLIVHRMLKKYVFDTSADKKDMTKDFGKVADYSEQSSIRERASQTAEYAVEDMKKAQYMEKYVGDVFEGIITSVMGYGFYVELPDTIEGLVHITTLLDDYYSYDEVHMELRGERSHKVYRIGQTVQVRVDSASRVTRQIDFSIATKEKKKKKEWKDNPKKKGYRKSSPSFTEQRGKYHHGKQQSKGRRRK